MTSRHVGGNLQLAERLVNGEHIRNRNKRSMAISALRSWLFNQLVSRRIEENLFLSPILGDAIKLADTNSFFIAGQADLKALPSRLKSRDAELTAPMIGKGPLASMEDAERWENARLEPYTRAISLLADIGLKQERRALVAFPTDLKWDIQDDCVKLSFGLASGCYATSVLRELVQY